MKPLPKRIKVYTIWYKVEEKRLNNRCGEIIFDDNTIYIDSELPLNQQWSTFWHEVIHAINITLDENIVEPLAQGINQVIQDNFK